MARWDDLAKQRQAELCRQQHPWTRSCGPKSRYGKLVASQNARKHRRRFQAECHFDVTVQETRDIQVGDRAEYTGSDPAIASICCGKRLEVFALQRGLAQCWISGIAALVTVPLGDLERCRDGHQRAD